MKNSTLFNKVKFRLITELDVIVTYIKILRLYKLNSHPMIMKRSEQVV